MLVPTIHLVFLAAKEIEQAVPQSPLEWAERWLQAVSWPALVILVGSLAWGLRGWALSVKSNMQSNATKLEETHNIAAATNAAVAIIQNNHLTHIEAGLVEQRAAAAEHLRVLTSIDKNIGILVDRNPRANN